MATACSLSYASSSKRAASGAFGIGGTALRDVSRGGRAPGEGSPSTHCTQAAAARLFAWDNSDNGPFSMQRLWHQPCCYHTLLEAQEKTVWTPYVPHSCVKILSIS